MVTTTTSSRTKSNNSLLLRSQSPSGRFYSKASQSSSAFASSTSSTFSSPSSSFFSNHQENHHIYTPPHQPMSQSFRYSLDTRSNNSPKTNRSISVSKKQPQPKISEKKTPASAARRRCMCSPTTHPGSFRCSLHKNVANPHGQGTASYTGNSLNMRRSAMTNSLVRIGGVEGEWVRRSLTTLIRPSSHHLRRRAAFQPRPSRLSVMSRAAERCN